MSGRTTADIVADLLAPRAYGWATASRLRKEAADRLTELDAEWQTLVRIAHASSLFQGGTGDRDPVVGLINALEMGRQAIDRLEALEAEPKATPWTP